MPGCGFLSCQSCSCARAGSIGPSLLSAILGSLVLDPLVLLMPKQCLKEGQGAQARGQRLPMPVHFNPVAGGAVDRHQAEADVAL